MDWIFYVGLIVYFAGVALYFRYVSQQQRKTLREIEDLTLEMKSRLDRQREGSRSALTQDKETKEEEPSIDDLDKFPKAKWK